MAGERAYRLTGEFSDPVLEDQFCRASWSQLIARGWLTQIASLLFVLAAVSDFNIFGWSPTFLTLFCMRLLVVPLTLMPLLLFSKYEEHNHFFLSMSFAQLFIFWVYLFVISATPEGNDAKALGAFLIIGVFLIGVPNRLLFNAIIGAIVTVAFVVVVHQKVNWEIWQIAFVCIMLVLVDAGGLLIARADAVRRRNEFLTLDRQTALNGQLKREVAIRLAAEQAMQASEESFQSIFYAAPLPIMLLDPRNYRLIHANHAACELFAIDKENMPDFDILAFLTEPDLPTRIDKIAVKSGAGEPIEVMLQTRAEHSIWVSISAALVRFQGLPALLVGLQDVTLRHQETEALRIAHEQVITASRSKSEFLANMSHELRTPLNAIIGFSEALERELFGPVGSPRYREYAEDIHDSGVHLLNLINDILDLSKIEAGHFKLHEEETDLNSVISSACRIVHYRAQQSKIGIEQTSTLPPLRLIVDERALKQIVINLVSNAIKFSHDGGRVCIDTSATDKRLRIAIIDNGIGMSEDDIPKALAPFTQLDGTLSRAHEGTGLGLPLAKRLTEMHGGTLTIESTPGVGTAIYVDLPVSRILYKADVRALSS